MSDPDNGDTTLLWSSSRSTPDRQSTSDIANPPTVAVPPNVPNMANGQVRSYRSSNRSFTRPYSAKTVFFYKEGDVYFAGLRVPVSKARYRTIESLLDDLNSNISMPFGVRHLTTPRGKTTIKSIDQLQHHGRYIASSFKTARPLNLSMVEKIQRIRQANRQNKNGRGKIPMKLSQIPITSKQILFVLNGKPSRIYRALLNPQRTMESLLEEVSEGLQMAIFKLYTHSGKRITNIDEIFSSNEARLLAVPRNERPVFRENTVSAGIPALPPISSLSVQSAVGGENSIERPQRAVGNSKMMALTSMFRSNKRDSAGSKSTPRMSEMKKVPSEELRQLPPSPVSKKSSEEWTAMLPNTENGCEGVNKSTVNKELSGSNGTGLDNEKGSEEAEQDEEKSVKNKATGGNEKEKAVEEEERREQTDEEIENDEVMEQQWSNNIANIGRGWFDSAVQETPEPMLTTLADQTSDNNETIAKAIPEVDFPTGIKENGMTYTVSVITGNRWAADTDLDLFIVLYGELNKSEKYLLRQDTHEPKFRQNRMDSFHIETASLGLLQKIVIGHNRIGYGISGFLFVPKISLWKFGNSGIGVYIERVLVTENIADGRQYLFQCSKWLDSGQHFSEGGRWELILHSGKVDGSGATTSNLNIVGYGSQGSSMTTKIYDSRMAKVPSASLVQVDFGEIGDLLKVRIEIDGNGEMPNYYLDYVELKDLDTEERMVSYVQKWLKIECEKNSQPFREFPVFRAAFEPLSEKTIAYVRIIGEIGETGRFPVDFKYASDLKQEISFKAEAVSVGRIRSTRLYVQMNDIGSEIYEGMQILQNIYDGHATSVTTASDWIAEKVTIRESHHAPYRYVMGFSRVKAMEKKDENTNEDDDGNTFIELLLSEMEGLSTKTSRKKALSRKKPKWILWMTVGEGSTLTPKVTLCTENTSEEMTVVATTLTDMIITFEQKAADVSMIIKVRVGIDDSQRLKFVQADDVELTNESMVEIQKMKLYDSENGDELRFPAVNTTLTSESVYEFPAVWPDIPPISNVIYVITINSGESSADFDVYLTLSGTRGDTGFRKLINDDSDPFQEKKMSIFEIEAVSIGEPLSTEIAMRNEKDVYRERKDSTSKRLAIERCLMKEIHARVFLLISAQGLLARILK
uniref:Doublecortin domain-containing protein n=1 Tax=Setaria digitata TaxID=48799 RepID=A0A915PSL7_9BILA